MRRCFISFKYDRKSDRAAFVVISCSRHTHTPYTPPLHSLCFYINFWFLDDPYCLRTFLHWKAEVIQFVAHPMCFVGCTGFYRAPPAPWPVLCNISPPCSYRYHVRHVVCQVVKSVIFRMFWGFNVTSGFPASISFLTVSPCKTIGRIIDFLQETRKSNVLHEGIFFPWT